MMGDDFIKKTIIKTTAICDNDQFYSTSSKGHVNFKSYNSCLFHKRCLKEFRKGKRSTLPEPLLRLPRSNNVTNFTSGAWLTEESPQPATTTSIPAIGDWIHATRILFGGTEQPPTPQPAQNHWLTARSGKPRGTG
jgi:hypothetical protein